MNEKCLFSDHIVPLSILKHSSKLHSQMFSRIHITNIFIAVVRRGELLAYGREGYQLRILRFVSHPRYLRRLANKLQ